MTDTSRLPTSVEVMWSPGCSSCRSLRRALRRAGVDTVDHDISSSAAAAARVRAVADGDETVPTVFVGGQALVNPSAGQVLAAIWSAPGSTAPGSPPTTGRSRSRVTWTTLRPGLTWALVVALVWTALAVWQPTTTWHLAPLLLAAAWPWVVGQDSSPGEASARRLVLLAGGGGLVVTVALTVILSTAGRFQGPTWTGTGSVTGEALLLAVIGAAAPTALGTLRTTRSTTGASARLGTRPVATSEDIVTVEGNAYFPLRSVPEGVLKPSKTLSFCPWKGVASYYDVHVEDQVVPDGAFTYRHPSPLARRIKGRVAFWNGIKTDATRHDH